MEAFWVPEQEWGNSQFETFFRSYEAVTTYVLLFGKYTKSGHFIYRRNKHLSCYSDHNEGSQCRWPDQKRWKRKLLLETFLQKLISFHWLWFLWWTGSFPKKERFLQAFSLTENTKDISSEDLQKIEAMIYTMADKFLENDDFEHVKEGIRMTRLGQMLF